MFKTFPEFSKVTIEDRAEYEKLVAAFPPISDISFTTLMIWWNFDDCLRVAMLNGNLVISYYLPGDPDNSGLSLVGTHNIAQSIQTIFAEQARQGQPQRLVHVPEFVVKKLQKPEYFKVTSERDYDEYIVPITRFHPLEQAKHNTRRKVLKFLKEAESHQVELKTMDLRVSENSAFLFEKANEWWEKQSRNDQAGNEMIALQRLLPIASRLDIRNICMYIDGKFCGFTLYHLSRDGKYAILNHIKVNYALPRMFDYLSYISTVRAAQDGAVLLNLEMDLGIIGLRIHKLEAGPIDYFRKYSVSPR